MNSNQALTVDQSVDGRLVASFGGTDLFTYVYKPTDVQLESPRPYFFPIRSLAGHDVAVFRPHDHVWHKGLAWSLPNVGTQNFWGGVTYYRGRGYVQEDNNGAIVHRDFSALAGTDDGFVADETLDYVASTGETWFTERRAFSVAVDPGAGTWTLAYRARMTNVLATPIPIGSPTTEGRPNAGYGGLFWRGPRSFTGGRVLVEGIEGGDELMGRRCTWMGFVGKHDGADATSTVVFADTRPDAETRPDQWFVRSEPFACIAPAPFFSEVVTVEPGAALDFSYTFTVADAECDPQRAAGIARTSVDRARALDGLFDRERWA
jgi:hypothetical protein